MAKKSAPPDKILPTPMGLHVFSEKISDDRTQFHLWLLQAYKDPIDSIRLNRPRLYLSDFHWGSEFRLAMTDRATIAGREVAK